MSVDDDLPARLFEELGPLPPESPEVAQEQIQRYLTSVRQSSRRGADELLAIADELTMVLQGLPCADPAGAAQRIVEPLRRAADAYDDAAQLATQTWHRFTADPESVTAGSGYDATPLPPRDYAIDLGKDSDAGQEATMTTTGGGHRGGFDPAQPRGADGKWIKVEDVLGYADDETCYATDRVIGAGAVTTDLALIEYPPEPGNQSGAFVSVATSPDSYNPVTGKEQDTGHIYCAPQLGPDEAEAAAGRLEELAGMVESGFQPPKPTKHTRARQRIELLLAEDRAAGRDRITVGDQEDFPLTTADLLKLLSEADPTLSAPQTRHAVRAHAASAAGGEDGTVWLDMEPDATGKMQIVVTAVEGTESPDDEYNRRYAAHHNPESARELAGKLRAFAHAARRRGDR